MVPAPPALKMATDSSSPERLATRSWSKTNVPPLDAYPAEEHVAHRHVADLEVVVRPSRARHDSATRVDVGAAHHRPARQRGVVAVDREVDDGDVARADEHHAARRAAAKGRVVAGRRRRPCGHDDCRVARADERERLVDDDVLRERPGAEDDHVAGARRGNRLRDGGARMGGRGAAAARARVRLDARGDEPRPASGRRPAAVARARVGGGGGRRRERRARRGRVLPDRRDRAATRREGEARPRGYARDESLGPRSSAYLESGARIQIMGPLGPNPGPRTTARRVARVGRLRRSRDETAGGRCGAQAFAR